VNQCSFHLSLRNLLHELFSGPCHLVIREFLVSASLSACSQLSNFLYHRVAFPTDSKSVWNTTHSRKNLCVVHLNFRKSLTEIPRNGCGTMRAAAVTWQYPISPDGKVGRAGVHWLALGPSGRTSGGRLGTVTLLPLLVAEGMLSHTLTFECVGQCTKSKFQKK